MLLAIDIGNTNVKVGAFDGERLLADWRVRTDRDRTSDEYGVLLQEMMRQRGIDPAQRPALALSSVVPAVTAALSDAARCYLDVEPFVVGPQADFGMKVHYRPPGDVGADRLVNAVAARALHGGPAIVVDFGTATKFEAVAGNGDYLGGAIAPGIGLSSDALFRTAARLYRVDLVAPSRAIGQTTVEAMQSGIMFGFAGQTDALVNRIRSEMGGQARVIATGGLAEIIRNVCETIDVVDPLLTLNGLRLVWERNRS